MSVKHGGNFGLEVLPEFADNIVIETRIGQIEAASFVSAENLVRDQVSLRANDFEPDLLPHMAVFKCTAVLLTINRLVEIHKLEFSLSISTKALGYPCSGQGLDAQEWSDEGKLVVIGTEDEEQLSYRFKELDYLDTRVVEYAPHSLSLTLNNLPLINKPSFHFIVAENDDPEPVEDSANIAVSYGAPRYLLDQ